MVEVKYVIPQSGKVDILVKKLKEEFQMYLVRRFGLLSLNIHSIEVYIKTEETRTKETTSFWMGSRLKTYQVEGEKVLVGLSYRYDKDYKVTGISATVYSKKIEGRIVSLLTDHINDCYDGRGDITVYRNYVDSCG